MQEKVLMAESKLAYGNRGAKWYAVSEDSDEFKRVASELKKSRPASRAIRVHRIQNRTLWDKFVIEK